MQTRAVDEPALADALMQASVGAFAALGGSGYARCDFRVDRDGRPLLLELNPNCGVFYPPGQYGGADLILANDPGGHAGFLTHLLICAMARRDRQARPWQIRFTKTRGFGMFATTAFAEGEVIARYESMPQVLVSGAHARSSWTGLRRDWFEAYAWPIGPDVHVTWSENPEEWRPINHSCDPTAWLSGLDLVARRPIRAGDEVTLEYATFCGPDMAPFACVCGAGVCRGRITGADFLRSEIRQRYAGHASPFVQAAWHASVAAHL